MQHKVGQVFYFVSKKSTGIVPMQVIEEVTRTTLEGEEKSYVVVMPDDTRTRTSIRKLKEMGDIYDDLDILRHHMIRNATSAIDEMINRADNLSREEFSVSQLTKVDDFEAAVFEEETGPIEKVENSSVQIESQDDIVNVDLGNGIVAKMKVSDLEKVAPA